MRMHKEVMIVLAEFMFCCFTGLGGDGLICTRDSD